MKRGWVLMVVSAGVLMMSANARAETATVQISPTVSGTSAGIEGTATLTDTPAGLKIDVQVAHAPPGTHGIHIHQYGECGNLGNAAGGHYNPDNVTHGFLPKDGLTKAHPGDVGNMDVGADGSGALSQMLPGVTLSGGTYSVAGRALVLHEKPDDFGQPTGNAGARIGCGPILVTKE